MSLPPPPPPPFCSDWSKAGWAVAGCISDMGDADARTAFMAAAADHFAAAAAPAAAAPPRSESGAGAGPSPPTPVHIVVCNVGTNVRHPRTVDYSAAEYTRIMGLNLDSTFHLCQLAFPHLKAAG